MSASAVAALAAYVVAERPDVVAVNGPSSVAVPIASAIATARGGTVAQTIGLGRFQLSAVIPPAPVAGSPRQASLADADLVIRWAYGFHEDVATPEVVVPDEIRARIALGYTWFWEDGGEPVCMLTPLRAGWPASTSCTRRRRCAAGGTPAR